ncbi:YdiU family protein [Paenibacillus motobuensis]|uniref:protein adenylyltransferase SelO n=1 Tax=Paenibacillus TaxID=44249 RepID=UPI002040F295|nr:MULTISPECIES: YdiU family protein [Paenibacillus]MCM3041183.1 YdiU family protein [Paenibacillus lutimineralis]MCM3648287.1 YdiU family protein [Paenibacillus motobuensis]
MTKFKKTGWNFDNSYTGLPTSFYTRIDPTPVRSPKLIVLNHPLASSLGLDATAMQGDEGIAVLAGNRIPEGALPIAQAYAGHQFGYFTMLGDGRAILLGEQISPQGERLDIQLKGPGRTPYSRGGDGRAALGPMLREYIISEAMHALGIPTTRSLAVVATGQPVTREKEHPGAILTRIAASHIRVGTFQYAANYGTVQDLRALADYTIERHYPYITAKAPEDRARYLMLLEEVIKRQAALIAKWQLVGFIHGVMNTDNMTISGETIDYGPCAFMDTYDPETVFSSIDSMGRYAYGNQPYIGGWNLARFAETLLPLLHDDQELAIELAQDRMSLYMDFYHEDWLQGMRSKLGLADKEEDDELLVNRLLELMKEYGEDYTNTFRALTLNELECAEMFRSPEFTEWHRLWKERLGRQRDLEITSTQLMKSSNPAIIPRNHQVEAALEAAEQGDLSVMERLLTVLSNPYAYSDEQVEYSALPETTKPYRTYCGT